MIKSQYFTQQELSCRCGCGLCNVTPELVRALDALRELAGVPIDVHDACRCPEHNLAEGGVPKSQHPEGTAADIVIRGKSILEMYELAQKVPAFARGGIGLYDSGFIHVDVRTTGKARWSKVKEQKAYVGIEVLLDRLKAKPASASKS